MKHVYLAALHALGFTQKQLFQASKEFEDISALYESLSSSQLGKLGIGQDKSQKILEKKENLSVSDLEKVLAQRKVQLVTFFDAEYPESLKQLSSPPFLLYVRGTLSSKPGLGIVGARKMTTYGKQAIEKIVPSLLENFCIISGGAMGCDAEAHKAALASSGSTIAVIGTGIDIDYPAFHSNLYDQIISGGGGIISQFPVGEPANGYNFPVRNELVAGLSLGVVVVEAEEKSGSLITAKLALDLGKDVYAFPGDISRSQSSGCNRLIQRGEAKLVMEGADILEEYNLASEVPLSETISFDNEQEKQIYEVLLTESLTLDGIVQKTLFSFSEVSTATSMMEIKGWLKKDVGGSYILAL